MLDAVSAAIQQVVDAIALAVEALLDAVAVVGGAGSTCQKEQGESCNEGAGRVCGFHWILLWILDVLPLRGDQRPPGQRVDRAGDAFRGGYDAKHCGEDGDV